LYREGKIEKAYRNICLKRVKYFIEKQLFYNVPFV